jgi:hypothetical protein
MYKRNAEMGQQVSFATKDCTEPETSKSEMDVTCSMMTNETYFAATDNEKGSSTTSESVRHVEDCRSGDSSCDQTLTSSDEISEQIILAENLPPASHPYENSEVTTLVCFDELNTVLDYARTYEKPWRRSLDKLVKQNILSDKATNNPETKGDQSQDQSEQLQELASLTIALEDARETLKQSVHVQDYLKRQKEKLYGNANRFPYESISVSLVLSYLDAWTMLQATQVNRLWRDCAAEDMFQTWEHLLQVDFAVSSASIMMNAERRAQLTQEEFLRAEKQRRKELRKKEREERLRLRKLQQQQQQSLENEAALASAASENTDQSKDMIPSRIDDIAAIRSENEHLSSAVVEDIANDSNRDKHESGVDVISSAIEMETLTRPVHGKTSTESGTISNSATNIETVMVHKRRENRVYEVVDLLTPTASIPSVSTPTAAATETATASPSATAISLPPATAQQPAPIHPTPAPAPAPAPAPFPSSTIGNVRSRWAKEMYRNMWRSYQQLLLQRHAFQSVPVVPLQWLHDAGSSLL